MYITREIKRTHIALAAVLAKLDNWYDQETAPMFNAVHKLLNDDVCVGAGKGGNLRHNFVEQFITVDGVTGYFYVCENCMETAGEVFDTAYDNYVEPLPASVYNSDGQIIYNNWILDLDASTIPDGGTASFNGVTTYGSSAFPFIFHHNL